MRHFLPLLSATLAFCGPLAAQEFDFGAPATQTASFVEQGATALIASGPWSSGEGRAHVPGTRHEGAVTQTVWRLETEAPTLDLAHRLQAQLQAQGWQIGFTCETRLCGGFDFRYALPLVTEPDMHVDLGDFRYIAAQRDGQALSLVISRARKAAFVQMTRVVTNSPPAAQIAPDTAPDTAPQPKPNPKPNPSPGTDLAARLPVSGSVVLDGLVFASGKGVLESQDPPALRDLAQWLQDHPAATIALVGHTDASGGLAGNVALSESRAQTVRKALIALGISGTRIEAKGVGYLAPRASNLTPEGRAQNRRVEVMLTSTQLVAP